MSSKKTILDVFTQISSEKDAAKPDLCLSLWNHLNSLDHTNIEIEENEDNIPKEITYTLRRLIQGLGSSRAIIRKSYFATLVSMLSEWDFSNSSITLSYFKSIVDNRLSKYESKGEEGEVLTGTILSYGVALRSKLFVSASVELQQEIFSEMLSKSKERSYLPLLTYTFITDFINSIDENHFSTVLWPVLSIEVLVDWSSQTFETLFCLLEIQNKFPLILKRKLIIDVFKTVSILHEDTIENVQKMMLGITWEPRLKHPIYNSIGHELCKNSENLELLIKFWNGVENILKSSPTRLQQLAVFTVFCSIINNVDLKQIPTLLTHTFLEYLLNSCRSSVNKTDKLHIYAKKTLQLIISRISKSTDEDISTTVYKILCKFLFESKQILIDKLTGVKVVFPCVSKLEAKHVKLLAKKCKSVILFQQKQETDFHWKFKERCYASQLLARLISHSQSQDMDWKIKHLKLMMKYAIFLPTEEDDVQLSNELSSVLKNSFFTALSHQLSHLENHRMVLISLVYYIDHIMTIGNYQLRTPLSDEMLFCWKNTMLKIQEIDLKMNKSMKRKTVMYVFHTLFLQMALYLFLDPVVAKDILTELDRCYKKEKLQFEEIKRNESANFLKTNSEPKWIEIAIELLLSLLSHDTYLLRQLISRIFPHLCPYLTAQATFQILQVFDPNSNNNILTEEVEEIDNASSEDEDPENQNNEDSRNSSELDEIESESDSDVEDLNDAEESTIEKTRQAVRDALEVAGSVTDTESIDLDDIDEEEGKKLDAALSEAFRNVQKSQNNKNKKQSAGEKALTHFRIRVLDLVDIYLDTNPSLCLVLDTIPILFALLEMCIKDNHQKPLENRIRSTMKKIGNLKKCSNMENVNEKLLVDILRTLMDKGVRTTSVFLDLTSEMSECCTFLLRMGIQIQNGTQEKSNLYNIFITSVDNFFLKRDCLLPISLFENILMKVNWMNNTKICERILSHSFNPAIRGFRRNQGLSLLCCFYKNTRLLSMLKENNDKSFIDLENKISEFAVQVLHQLKNNEKIKSSFISEFFLLLYVIKTNKFSGDNFKWNEINNDDLISKNVIKKKKKKRKKNKEHFISKRLRTKIGNDVDVLKFSKTTVFEM